MHYSLTFCVLAAMLALGDSSTHMRRGSFEIPDTTYCEPGSCYAKDGEFCLCPETGESDLCISFDPFIPVRRNPTQFCYCEPGEMVYTEELICTCPPEGRITKKNCMIPLTRSSSSSRQKPKFEVRRYDEYGNHFCAQLCTTSEPPICFPPKICGAQKG